MADTETTSDRNSFRILVKASKEGGDSGLCKPATTRSQGSQDERPEVETSHPQQQPPPPPAREYDWRDGFLSPCSDHLGHPNPRASPKHSRPVRSASDTAEVPAATTHDDPPTHDLDILSKRLANVGLMDSMCPAAPAGAPTDERWATQVHSLLTHLANKVDAEIESQSFMRRRKAFHRSNSMANVGQGGMPGASGLTGVYEHVLKDWVHRLQQVPLEVIRLYPGLKRELDKIRWQYGSLTHA
ncbi:hypothetical protein BG005_007204 [Podila minutissima]|nr:hypothetical protein BG005_007204 [Podila minutissima]